VRPERHSRRAVSPRILENRREQAAADPSPLPLGDDGKARQMALTGNDGAGAVGGATGKAERDADETVTLGCDEDPRPVLARPAAARQTPSADSSSAESACRITATGRP
jgi:hypothetical protein